MEEAFDNADIVYPKSWAPFAAMQERTKLYAAAAKKTTAARLAEILSLCRAADLAVKSESTDYGRLRVLVCEAAK